MPQDLPQTQGIPRQLLRIEQQVDRPAYELLAGIPDGAHPGGVDLQQLSLQIARLLKLSGRNVEAHRSQIMERLGVRDVANLMLEAIRRGLISVKREKS